jgi:hypothetical protein
MKNNIKYLSALVCPLFLNTDVIAQQDMKNMLGMK